MAFDLIKKFLFLYVTFTYFPWPAGKESECLRTYIIILKKSQLDFYSPEEVSSNFLNTIYIWRYVLYNFIHIIHDLQA